MKLTPLLHRYLTNGEHKQHFITQNTYTNVNINNIFELRHDQPTTCQPRNVNNSNYGILMSRISTSNVNLECQPRTTRMSTSNVNLECQPRMSTSNVNLECQPRMSTSNVNLECQPRMSTSNVNRSV